MFWWAEAWDGKREHLVVVDAWVAVVLALGSDEVYFRLCESRAEFLQQFLNKESATVIALMH